MERVHVGKMRGEGEGEDKCVWWRVHARIMMREEGGGGQIHSVERVHVGKMRGEGEGEDKCVWWRECMRE